jgi:hypothetical protein
MRSRKGELQTVKSANEFFRRVYGFEPVKVDLKTVFRLAVVRRRVRR